MTKHISIRMYNVCTHTIAKHSPHQSHTHTSVAVRCVAKWADLRKYDRNYLVVARDGVPNHFESMDGAQMRILLKHGK